MAAYVTCGRSRQRAGSWRWGRSFGLVALGCATVFSIAACSKLGLGNSGGSDEMSWARAALERNDRLEVVAADPQTNTFTVRVKETGELRMVRADQVVAGPQGAAGTAGGAGTPGGGLTGAAGAPPSGDGARSGAAASQDGGAAQGAGAPAGGTSPATAPPSAPAEATLPPTTTAANAAANTTDNAAAPGGNSGGGKHPGAAGPAAASNAPRTGFRSEPTPPSEAPNPNSDVASITPGGRTLESGPGYAIKVASKTAPAPARTERSSTTAAVERRHEPIICQGERLMQIDNRNIEFDGDAVAAEDGCEIHITNSRIVAKGVGVAVRRANVHIDNSQIEGDTASIDSSEGGQVYAASSKFKGLSRRLDNSSFHDLGGNVWN